MTHRYLTMAALGSAALCATPPSTIAQVRTPAGGGPKIERIDLESRPRPSLRALRIDEPINWDGVLDEPAWLRADSASDFMQTIPRDGYPMPERTVVRVMYDLDNLYVGARMYQSEPYDLKVPGLEQDYPPYAADAFGIGLDPYFDRQNGYVFSMNSAGAVWDGQAFNDSRWVNSAWEGVVHLGTSVDEEGWTAELVIPFTTLRFDSSDDEQTWGINFLRRILRTGRVDGYWAPMLRRHAIHTFSRAGTLTGLRGLKQGRNLQIKPWVSGARTEGAVRTVADQGNAVDAGIDIKYGVTSRLTLDLTAFTDFSQVEADQEQLNLTRFSLFFPEKRDFFMENAGIFTVGDVRTLASRTGSTTRDFTLFHSRRIGLSEDRRPIPIAGGGRLTGRVGEFEVGVLDMQTREFGDPGDGGYMPAENFAVLRLRRNVHGNSDVGVLFTNRQATSQGSSDRVNRTYAADANFRFGENLSVNSYLAATSEPDVVGDRVAARVNVTWRDHLWDASAFVKRVGDAFNPGLGFARRTGVRQGYMTLGVHPQPSISHVQELNPYVEINAITDLQGSLETRDVRAGLDMRMNDGGVITLGYDASLEHLSQSTRISGVSVAAGDYEFNQASVSYRPNAAGVLSAGARVSHGGFFDGNRTSISANVLFRPSHHLTINASVQRNNVSLAGTSFRADVYATRVRYAYNTKLFALAYVQFNDLSDEFVAHLRLNVIHAPLSDVFLVYSERRYVGEDPLLEDLLERTLTIKATRLLVF